MNLSLNEIEAIAKRAMRGAGHHWGAAEDAAKATRWLCLHGIDGASALANLLSQDFASSIADHTPKSAEPEWSANGDLCPIMAGTLLSDCASHLRKSPIIMYDVAVPVLLLPFASNAARRLGTCVTLNCGGQSSVTNGSDLAAAITSLPRATQFSVRIGGELANPLPNCTRATPDPTALSILNRFAQRTYAPATEQSRLLGAGAGLSDND